MEGSDQKSIWEESEQYGEWKHSYKKLSLIGLFMMGGGGVLALAIYFVNIGGENLEILSMILLGIGLFVAVPGTVGYLDEKKKEGKERTRTKEGFASVIVLVIGMLVFSNVFFLFLILNTLAIILGVIGMKESDNTTAIGGVIGGIIMFVLTAILIYFGSPPI